MAPPLLSPLTPPCLAPTLFLRKLGILHLISGPPSHSNADRSITGQVTATSQLLEEGSSGSMATSPLQSSLVTSTCDEHPEGVH